MSEAEFWKLTGKQLSLLIRRRKQEIKRQQWMIAGLESIIANFSTCRPKEPLSAEDFMPNYKKLERTDQEVAEDFAAKFQFMAIGQNVKLVN